jgi:hypothetical protein
MSDDEITLFPLLGYSTFTLPGELLMLALELPENPENPQGPKQYLNLGLRAAGARELAESLLRAATASEMGQSPKRSPS